MRGLLHTHTRMDPVKLLLRRLTLLFLVVAAFVLGKAVWALAGKNNEAATARNETALALADLDKRNIELQAKIANLRTNRGQEAALREQYGLAKQGEGVIVIVDEKAPPPQPRPAFPSLRWFEGLFSRSF